MNPDTVLEAFAAGEITQQEAKRRLLGMTYIDTGCAKLDHHREVRCGGPEVVYCEGKTPQQVLEIFEELMKCKGRVLGTRASREHYEMLPASLGITYDPVSRLIIGEESNNELVGKIMVVSAGTSDLPVAEEAAKTAEFLGSRVERHHDCGVAGIHRLFSVIENISGVSAIIAVAGMEGALPSVVGGLVSQPVIAVPTSVGYGANFEGLAPLLAMMNSCAPGVGVVNIDNGFGAAFLAHKINMQIHGR